MSQQSEDWVPKLPSSHSGPDTWFLRFPKDPVLPTLKTGCPVPINSRNINIKIYAKCGINCMDNMHRMQKFP